ncbi:MAG: zinc-binding alcohol dehydrogenase family protein [Hespellia sp.]|nr:zinc-binding alcohol dehydrogenase family protein [Hespellia sp.]
MKAIKVPEPFKIVIEEVEEPQVKSAFDVKIKVTSGGICGSDIGIWNGTNSLATYPRVIGHEFGGIVTQVGSGVKRVSVGDRVAVDPVVSCGQCYACKIGRHNVCSALEVMGVHRDGGFCEYVCVPEENVHRFKADFDEKMLSVAEPFTIGVQINTRAQIQKGEKVLIMGAGPIGIAAMQVAKMNGAEVIMSDLVESRLEKAKMMGADRVVLIPTQNLEKELVDFTDGEGIPVIIDTVCIPASFQQSVELACPAGRVVVIGLKSQPSEIVMAEITKKELTIVGSRLNCNCFDKVIEGLESGSLKPDKYVTHMFSYEQVEQAFETIRTHPQDVLKAVITF